MKLNCSTSPTGHCPADWCWPGLQTEKVRLVNNQRLHTRCSTNLAAPSAWLITYTIIQYSTVRLNSQPRYTTALFAASVLHISDQYTAIYTPHFLFMFHQYQYQSRKKRSTTFILLRRSFTWQYHSLDLEMIMI